MLSGIDISVLKKCNVYTFIQIRYLITNIPLDVNLGVDHMIFQGGVGDLKNVMSWKQSNSYQKNSYPRSLYGQWAEKNMYHGKKNIMHIYGLRNKFPSAWSSKGFYKKISSCTNLPPPPQKSNGSPLKTEFLDVYRPFIFASP